MILSKIILGGEQLGGFDHGFIDFKKVEQAFKISLKFGINTIDTSNIYNLGIGEKRIVSVFNKKERNRLNIITKGGLTFEYIKNSQRAKVYQNYDDHFLKQNILDSLKRLKIKKIPLFLIHYPPKNIKTLEKICIFLESVKKQNLIENYGFSNIGYKLVNLINKKFKIYAIQNSLNLLNINKNIDNFNKINPDIIKIVHSSLAQGYLTGKYTNFYKFKKNDRRHRLVLFSKSKILQNKKKIIKFVNLANKINTTPAILSLSYLFSLKCVDSVIVGIKSINHLNESISGLNFNLDENLKIKINSIFNINN